MTFECGGCSRTCSTAVFRDEKTPNVSDIVIILGTIQPSQPQPPPLLTLLLCGFVTRGTHAMYLHLMRTLLLLQVPVNGGEVLVR